MKNLVPSWKNTLNHDLDTYKNIIDVLHKAAYVNYPFFTWTDDRVYQVGKDYSPKGVFKNFYAVPTEYFISNLNSV